MNAYFWDIREGDSCFVVQKTWVGDYTVIEHHEFKTLEFANLFLKFAKATENIQDEVAINTLSHNSGPFTFTSELKHAYYFGAGNWTLCPFGQRQLVVVVNTPPNWFWRITQYLIFGNLWKKN